MSKKIKPIYGYASRTVTPIRDLDAVDEELEYIYSINNDGEDIMSIQVIPLFLSKEYPALPSAYCISYIYRYIKGSVD